LGGTSPHGRISWIGGSGDDTGPVDSGVDVVTSVEVLV
jgi:hypothetical protein